MFSEALKIMDRNTTKYMIDELKQTITDYSNKITTLEAENIALKAQLAAKLVISDVSTRK